MRPEHLGKQELAASKPELQAEFRSLSANETTGVHNAIEFSMVSESRSCSWILLDLPRFVFNTGQLNVDLACSVPSTASLQSWNYADTSAIAKDASSTY